jgi:uncharacterized repeat protein (TIGR01451 family)
LFVLSLLLQYLSFAVAQPVLAVHDGSFQLDGNAVDSGAGDDWANHPGADAFIFVDDPLSQSTDRIFTGGGSKDDLNTTGWAWTTGSVPDKDNIEDAFAALYDDIIYFGLDRFANNGDAQVGFWFFKNGVGTTAGGGFAPAHSVGDLLVLSEFTNGGAVSTIRLYEWVGSGGDTNGTLDLVGSGAVCTAAPAADKACALANTDDEDAPWPYSPKFGTNGTFPAGSFFEGGLDLAKVYGGNPPCFSSFLVETRSSQEVDAVLKDFATGDFNTCAPPSITTQVSAAIVDFGGSVTDTATLSGDDGPVTGTVSFFVCTPAQITAAGCPTGGSQVGSAVTIVSGSATSAAYAPAAAGKYCFRAEYTPDANSQYLEGSHTNATTECFNVPPATIDVTKTADAATINAGDQIGFTVTIANTGAGTANGLAFTDALPSGPGVSWSISPASAGWSISGAAPNQSLVYSPTSLAGNTSTSVHVVSNTTSASCKVYNNTAAATSTNDGSDSATASVTVNCPDIVVVKTAGTSPISVGGTASFTITVSNSGAGTAHGVVLTDPLPGGLAWSDDSASCSIAGGTLTCNIGDLAPGASFSVTVSANTDTPASETDDCGVLNNVATASSTNEPSTALANNTDDAAITVACASALEIQKSVAGNSGGIDPILGVPLAKIGDTLTYTLEYTGVGPIHNAVITDVLPVGLDYVEGSAAGDASFSFVDYDVATRTLTWTAASLPDPANGTVSYDVTVLEAAAEEVQPLVNTAAIDSDETERDTDTASVAVLPAPEALTPPPTSTLSPESGTSSPGFALMLVLLGLAGLGLGVGFITPVPERVRRRDRLG